ncbi:hypothetical protein [Rhodococcus wratislaviensis]|uniref:Uncharacterized protein n=1 Tax=Rhodococcus wratislaviensis NBRC 100605 TaxID=1219028 RepID=X0PNT6_RHOWR|nr:hypothetical protein RW1_012_01020 [Rhodococcus wratislaviensis NBRC 100605]
MNSREYRQWRQRRRAAWIEVNRQRIHSDTDAECLIEFASRWAPFGGATEEEILVQFGMTMRRFIERLWQVIPESNCLPTEIRILASVYPYPAESAVRTSVGVTGTF